MEKYLIAAKIKQEIQQRPNHKNGIEQYYCEQDPIAWEIYINGIDISLPFSLREIKGPQDAKNISFEFVCPINSNDNKKVRIIIFFRGKINVLGACDSDTSYKIYNFLNDFILKYRDIFIVSQPLPDYNKLKEKLLQELLSKVTRKNKKKIHADFKNFY